MAKGHGALIFDNSEKERVGIKSLTITTIVTPKAEEKACLPTPPMLVPNDSYEPLFVRLRRRVHWWQAHATPQVVRLIRHGLPADRVFPPPHRQFPHVARSQQEVQDALKLMEEYLGVHAVRLRSGAVPNLLSWFVVYKPKPRFILNCIPVNRCLRPPPYFGLHNWSTIFPFLVKGHWAMKIDLKHACFHLGLEPGLEDLLNFQIGSQVF